jgi:radical SAM superfamily enzyme YgiQ (UPF0313 family)
MKIDIVVVHVPRYRWGHEVDFVPPLTGIHLAALTPPGHQVRVIHQQVQPVELETDADLVALSFFSGFAGEAFALARALRARGRRVVAGGPHATFCPEQTAGFFDSVVVGEAESAWPRLVEDAEAGRLQPVYRGEAGPLEGLPLPRYDLLSPAFFVPRVVQATRGCPFACSFCSVPTLNPGYRTRPVAEVIRDLRFDGFRHWWQRKLVWFWDDNLTIRRPYILELLRAMVPERKWWLTQASLDVATDPELLDLMQRSGCIGIFFGLESFGAESLQDAHKPQNRAEQYRQRIAALHERGICVMAGFVSGFDGDTPESIRRMARQLEEVGVDVPFLSVLTPYPGTPIHQKMQEEGRLLQDRGPESFNGYNVTFKPRKMSPEELLAAHRALWREAFSLRNSLGRIWRGLFTLRPGAFLMSACMNAFYCLKNLRGNHPRVFGPVPPDARTGPAAPARDPAEGGAHPAPS